MSWQKVARTVGKVAPLLGTVIGGPAGPAVGALVSSVLGLATDDPDAVDQALATMPTDQMRVELSRIETEHRERLLDLHLQAQVAQQAQINKTMRAEAGSDDPFVRRWRPTWGYVCAGTWGVQSLALLWVAIGAVSVIKGGGDPGPLLQGAAALAGALTVQWGMALAVLGVNVTSRSKDKQVASGQQPAGLLSFLRRSSWR